MIFVGIAVSLTGRYMFGADMDYSATNYGSLSDSILTTFQLLTGDSWSSVMYDSLLSKQDEGPLQQVTAPHLCSR